MKTKVKSFCLVAVLFALTFATGAFADAESGFYEKEHIRGFISIGGDYRGMSSEFQKYVNTTAFAHGVHTETAPGDSAAKEFSGDYKYSMFDDYYLGLHVNIGAQYKQFLTWFDINFMPTQTSERPSSSYKASSEDGTSMSFPLYDVKWFAYGADWMFGWKLFGENTVINLIPAVGVGFNLINFHLASNFDVPEVGGGSSVRLRDRYYSTIASTFNSELELRLELGQFGLGIYGGYRVIRYNELEIEGNTLETITYDTDNNGDAWFLGLRLTWTFLSDWQSKEKDRL